MVAPEEKRKEITKDFIESSKELLTPDKFFESTKIYSGSIDPNVVEEVDVWKQSGSIPPQQAAGIYAAETIADLSGVAIVLAPKAELRGKFEEIYAQSKVEVTEEGLYKRVSEYQDALVRLASSSKMVQDTFSEMSEIEESWIEVAKNNLTWIKRAVTMSIGRIYQAFGKIYDKVTDTIDDIIGVLSDWSSSLKNRLVEGIRKLSQNLLQLLNNLISALFGWLSKLRKIAQEQGFSLSKVTVTIDPLTLRTVSVLGFSIPIPEVKLPKIEMEFT